MANKVAQYQIILLKNNERIETVSSHFTVESARKKFNTLLEEDKKVVFPIEFINKEKIEEVKFHLAIIKRKGDEIGEKYRVTNDYGQYVDVTVEDNDEWLLYDRQVYNFEETFWVYGHNPRVDRKKFDFIYDNLILSKSKDKSSFLYIKVYKNKVLFETTFDSNLVICKCNQDAVRLHDELYYKSLQDKLKFVMFGGDITKNKRLNYETRDKIMALTHWNKRKVNRCTT